MKKVLELLAELKKATDEAIFKEEHLSPDDIVLCLLINKVATETVAMYRTNKDTSQIDRLVVKKLTEMGLDAKIAERRCKQCWKKHYWMS